MSWLDRLRECRYVSPSGIEFTPLFDDVQREGTKKAPVTELPQQNDPDVQDLGNTAHRMTMRMYFSGRDYDETADAFWNALGEQGPGTLSHPRYGDLTVLPLSRQQVEDFVEQAGRAVFTVEFVRLSDELIAYPVTVTNRASRISDRVATLQSDIAEAFEREFDIEDVRDRVGLIDQIRDGVDVTVSALRNIAGEVDDINTRFNAIARDIQGTVDDLIQAPAALAESVIRLVRTPARIGISIREKIRGYRRLYELYADRLIPGTASTSQASLNGVFLSAVGMAIAECSLTPDDTATREQTARNANQLLEVRLGIAENSESLEADYPDYFLRPEQAQSLNESLTESAAILYERSFSLSIERIVNLDRDVTPLDFVYSVYGSIDRLDEWIQQNELKGNDLFILRVGREVRYYE